MLTRTNIYLQLQTIQFFKNKAQEEGVTMAKLIRKFLEQRVEEENKNWAESLLSLAKTAAKSKFKDLSKKHDRYLYG